MGIDWASDSYQICVADDKGEVLEEIQVEHSGEGIRQCIDWLLKLADGDVGTVAVAIEVPHGAMVENLIESNLAVFAINPKQMDRFRDRHTVAGAKDDDLDAFVMADSLRTDQRCFHRVDAEAPDHWRRRTHTLSAPQPTRLGYGICWNRLHCRPIRPNSDWRK